ncbi:hypothetical protein BAX51_01090 [Mycoplasmoides gallisepticum]|uniref:Uncharacterized protein n=1 Tax=Mycoplasmoides gallisepticum TaxID=2096 RepID=A0AB36DS56_MYCGL|nr:hypothetical protein [Mycoplasmoides gallisepticum]ADC31111.1 hypothetical protein MGF_1151 [Mycoplasmoides gallisepticum str. F]OBU78425.1 hypothetical protein BAY36_03130 [Mycoplasmoides gallisepticum]OBU79348.1 hypothetical protein BAY37_01380 [Mycoplasmoides gallisepticum]OBU80764.1 hypothetical protein BAX53_01500 [Mycoplasmoides gallisepticum]OBU80949.1 hypothetical protein BAX52_00325 [Mycoplasmoides gallisepticum]
MSRLSQNKIIRETKKKQAQLNKIFNKEDESIVKYKQELDKISSNILIDYQTNKPRLLDLKVNYSDTNLKHINELKDLLSSFDSNDLINIIDQARFLNNYSSDLTTNNQKKSWILNDPGLADINKIEENFENIKALSGNFVTNSHTDLDKLKKIIELAKEKINDPDFFKPVEKIKIGTNRKKAKHFKILLGFIIGLISISIFFLFIIIGIFKVA